MIFSFIVSIFNFLFSNSFFACATCFGDPNANTSKALNYAILSLLGLTGTILVSIVTFFVFLFKKKK